MNDYGIKIKYLLILAVLFVVAGCHHKQSNGNPENDSIVNIREMGLLIQQPLVKAMRG